MSLDGSGKLFFLPCKAPKFFCFFSCLVDPFGGPMKLSNTSIDLSIWVFSFLGLISKNYILSLDYIRTRI